MLSSEFLHLNEKNDLTGLKHEYQWQYLVGKYVAKLAISGLLSGTDIKMSEIQIQRGVFQQPIVKYPGQEKIEMSLSHHQYLAAAVATYTHHPVGIDIELISAENLEAIHAQLTCHERWLIKQEAFFTDTLTAYYVIWTIKEALSKALKTGLMVCMDIYELSRISISKTCWQAEFKNFYQYRALSFLLDGSVVSLVFPKRSTIDINVQAIQRWYKAQNKPIA